MGKVPLRGSKKELWDKVSEEIIQHWDHFELIQDELKLAINAVTEIKRTRTKLELNLDIESNVFKFYTTKPKGNWKN